MSYTTNSIEIKKIISSYSQEDFIEYMKGVPEKSRHLYLECSIRKQKSSVTEYLLEQGVEISNTCCIDDCVQGRDNVKFIKLLEKYNIDVMPRGGMPFLRASHAFNIKLASYLIEKIDIESGLKMTLFVHLSEMNDLLRNKKISESERMERYDKHRPFIELIIKHSLITDEIFNKIKEICENQCNSEVYTYFINLALNVRLSKNETTKRVVSRKI